MAAAHEPTDRLARWIVLVALLCLATVLICVWVLTRDYRIPTVLTSSAVGLAAGIVCHEFGHMLCAVLLSAPVQLVSIGIGPVLWRCRICETRFELRAVPCAVLSAAHRQQVFEAALSARRSAGECRAHRPRERDPFSGRAGPRARLRQSDRIRPILPHHREFGALLDHGGRCPDRQRWPAASAARVRNHVRRVLARFELSEMIEGRQRYGPPDGQTGRAPLGVLAMIIHYPCFARRDK